MCCVAATRTQHGPRRLSINIDVGANVGMSMDTGAGAGPPACAHEHGCTWVYQAKGGVWVLAVTDTAQGGLLWAHEAVLNLHVCLQRLQQPPMLNEY
jgi:hypothetical protein